MRREPMNTEAEKSALRRQFLAHEPPQITVPAAVALTSEQAADIGDAVTLLSGLILNAGQGFSQSTRRKCAEVAAGVHKVLMMAQIEARKEKS